MRGLATNIICTDDGRRRERVAHSTSTRQRDGWAGQTTPRVIARGEGWLVADVVCTCGAQDDPYEERHSQDTIAIV